MYEDDIELLTSNLRSTLKECVDNIEAEDVAYFSEIIDLVAKNVTVGLSENIDFELYGIDIHSQKNICGQFGSVTSRDLDMFVVLDDPMYVKFRDGIRNYLNIWLQGMIDARGLGYTKPDIQFIMVNSQGTVEWAEKGNVTEINNSIFHTYPFHRLNGIIALGDLRPCPIQQVLSPEIGIKALKTVRSFITFLSRTSYSESLREHLFSESLYSRINGIVDAHRTNDGILVNLESFDKPNIDDNDILKSIAVSFLQLEQLIDDRPVLFQKETILATDKYELYPILLGYKSEFVSKEDSVAFLDEFIQRVLVKLRDIVVIDENGHVKCEGDRHVYNVRKEKALSIGDYLCT